MREIKFRVWDKILCGWSRNIQHFIHLRTDTILYVFPEQGDRLLFEQYIGLKDKNGKDIYEGDIIEKLKTDRPYSSKKKSCATRSIVVWYPGFDVPQNEHNNKSLASDPSIFNCEPGFTGKEIYNEKGYHCQDWSDFSQCEIIGNVHENPALLRGHEPRTEDKKNVK